MAAGCVSRRARRPGQHHRRRGHHRRTARLQPEYGNRDRVLLPGPVFSDERGHVRGHKGLRRLRAPAPTELQITQRERARTDPPGELHPESWIRI